MSLISIALPAHNEELSIFNTLEKICASDFNGNEFKIYICLSGCTDNTLLAIEKFKVKNPNVSITVLEDKVGGKVRALKKLDNFLSEEIIVFMDSDCRPRKDTLYRVFNGLLLAPKYIPVCSGNSIDTRYSDKSIKSINLIDSFNRTFWQHPPRKIINGQLFCARKGIVQAISDEVILDDPYLTIIHWHKFIKDNDALIDQGSPQSIWDVVRYQKTIQAGKEQLKKLLGEMPEFNKITTEMYAQFDIRLKDRQKYYPNIRYSHLILINILLRFGRLVGKLANPVWHQTASSKVVATD